MEATVRSKPPGVEEKWWNRRYELFSKYDLGIEINGDQWFSVTPEVIGIFTAEFIRKHVPGGVVVDACSGAGGNTVHLARYFKVLAVEIDKQTLETCKHNCSLYGVSINTDFFNEDFLQFEPPTKVDLVFISPPWGGVEYSRNLYDVEKDLAIPISKLFQKSKSIAENVVMFLPKSSNLAQLSALSKEQCRIIYTYQGVILKGLLAVWGPSFHCEAECYVWDEENAVFRAGDGKPVERVLRTQIIDPAESELAQEPQVSDKGLLFVDHNFRSKEKKRRKRKNKNKNNNKTEEEVES